MHSENSYLRVLQIKLDNLQQAIDKKLHVEEYTVKEIMHYFEMLDRLSDTLSKNDLYILKKEINRFQSIYKKTNDLQDVKVAEEITKDKVEEQELLKLVNSLKEDISNLDEYSTSTEKYDNDWPLELINNIISKVSYLKDNLNSLTNEQIKELKKSLNELLNIYNDELFWTFAFVLFIGSCMTIIEVFLSVLFSTWWVAIILFLITPLFLKFKVYHDLKSYIRGEAFKKFSENKKDIKKLKKELAKMLKRKNTNQVEETKEIPKQKHVEVEENITQKEKPLSMEELISHIESIIMLLKNEEENAYRKKVYDILQTYRQDLDKAKGMPNNFKEDYLNMSLGKLKKELTEIENEILTKYNASINEQKEKIADNLFNTFNQSKYLNEVSLLALMKSLNDLLPDTDLILSLNIKDRFAKCFYDTLSNLPKDNTLINNIDESYLDRVIIYGENLINEYENNIYILEYRNKLYKLKNNLSKRDYLKYLYQFLTTTNILKKETLGNDNKVIYRI